VKVSRKYSAGTCFFSCRSSHLLRASRAFDQHHGAGLRPALFHRRECSIVVGGESVPVLRQEVGFEGIDDGGQADHLIAPQRMPKPSIRPLMRSMAWCLVWSVRWV
jgi:hypothetical protein